MGFLCFPSHIHPFYTLPSTCRLTLLSVRELSFINRSNPFNEHKVTVDEQEITLESKDNSNTYNLGDKKEFVKIIYGTFYILLIQKQLLLIEILLI